MEVGHYGMSVIKTDKTNAGGNVTESPLINEVAVFPTIEKTTATQSGM